MSKKDYPTVDYIRQCFRYEDGKVFWLVRPREHFKNDHGWRIFNSKFSGMEAGNKRTSDGDVRWQVGLGRYGSAYRSHIVWSLHGNEWPSKLDHKNVNPLDDRIDNLRLSTHSQNMANKLARSDSTSGYKGVTLHKKSGLWMSRIKCNGVVYFLGYFKDPAKAHAAYSEAAKKHFGEFAHDGT